MAELIVVYWRDIPAQVIVRAGRRSAKRPLAERFEQAIDRCAMRVGARDSDAYLAEWRKGAPAAIEADDLDAAADRAAADIEARYDAAALKTLVDNAGRAGQTA